MKGTIAIIVILISIGLISGCQKSSFKPGATDVPSIELLQAFLGDGPWQLISTTITYPSGTKTRYVGSTSDTIVFNYTYNGGVMPTSFVSYINGINYQSGYQLHLDSTLTCSPAWKPGLSDTMLCASFSDPLLVIRVKNTSSTSVGIEIDSLKKIRFWHP